MKILQQVSFWHFQLEQKEIILLIACALVSYFKWLTPCVLSCLGFWKFTFFNRCHLGVPKKITDIYHHILKLKVCYSIGLPVTNVWLYTCMSSYSVIFAYQSTINTLQQVIFDSSNEIGLLESIWNFFNALPTIWNRYRYYWALL